MDDHGYSTIVDAILFLAMVSVCALILSAAIAGSERQRGVADSSLRAKASSSLASMESSRADYVEYRILGNYVDSMAEKLGIDPGAWLYRDVTRAVLGRGSRHKAVMEVAAEAAACQFTVNLDGNAVTLNPLTGDYRSAAQGAVSRHMGEKLDGRYGWNFTLRWVPFAEVPFEGSITCGSPVPPGAASASALVTMPYRTRVTPDAIEEAISTELDDIGSATYAYQSGGPEDMYKAQLRSSLDDCLRNTSHMTVSEILGNTVYEVLPPGDVSNPLSLLATFSDNDSTQADPLYSNSSLDLEGWLSDVIVRSSASSLDSLADEISAGIDDGSIAPGEERALIVQWMSARYSPSTARATVSVWVSGHA